MTAHSIPQKPQENVMDDILGVRAGDAEAAADDEQQQTVVLAIGGCVLIVRLSVRNREQFIGHIEPKKGCGCNGQYTERHISFFPDLISLSLLPRLLRRERSPSDHQ